MFSTKDTSFRAITEDPYPEVYIPEELDNDTYKEVVRAPLESYPEAISGAVRLKYVATQGAASQIQEPKRSAWYSSRGWILGLVAITVAVIAVATAVGILLGRARGNDSGMLLRLHGHSYRTLG